MINNLKENKMINPLVSIIVPVYNVEKYLAECLDSIVNQTYSNIEIVIVNDCSPDNSEKIILEYAKRDPVLFTLNMRLISA